MDSVFPLLNSAELPPYIWGNDEREKVRALLFFYHRKHLLEPILCREHKATLSLSFTDPKPLSDQSECALYEAFLKHGS